MKDLVGTPLEVGDVVVHVSNSSGSIYGTKGVIISIDPEKKNPCAVQYQTYVGWGEDRRKETAVGKYIPRRLIKTFEDGEELL